jgi:hypothetical protein
MPGHGRKDCDEKLLLAMAAGASQAQAAQQAGVSERTVTRRLADATFKARVNEARAELVRRAVSRLSAAGIAAADELYRLLRDGCNDMVKLGAARAVLQNMLAGFQMEQVARQMEQLDQRLAEMERREADRGAGR